MSKFWLAHQNFCVLVDAFELYNMRSNSLASALWVDLEVMKDVSSSVESTLEMQEVYSELRKWFLKYFTENKGYGWMAKNG